MRGGESNTGGQVVAMATPRAETAAISVVIPSYRRPVDLKRCLAALQRQVRPADEVLVVHRADDGETIQVVSEFRDEVRGLRGTVVDEPGLVAAINRGLDCAGGDFVVLTDDDAEAFPDWLERIEAAFLSDASLGAVGGRDWIQNSALLTPPTVDRVGVVTWWGQSYGNHHCILRGHVQKVQFLKGVNFAIRSSALGGYRVDTALRGSGAQVGTEIDLCTHMKNRGYGILFDDQILVKHYASPRPDSDGKVKASYEARHDVNSRIFLDIRFNNQYLTAKHFSGARGLACLLNGLLLGSYYTPGLLAAMKRMVLKGDWGIWQRFLTQSRCAIDGYGAGRRARSLERGAGEKPEESAG